MPIKFQCLGGGGGGLTLRITTYPNIKVDLRGEKVTRITMSDGLGHAEFNGLIGGTYTLTVKNKSKQILIKNVYDEYICDQIKDLPIGAKIKFSNGYKFVLKIRNPEREAGTAHEGTPYENNYACLLSEYIADDYRLDREIAPQNNTELSNKLKGYYNALTQSEKDAILLRLARTDGQEPTTLLEYRFYLLSINEAQVPSENGNFAGDGPWGFTSNQDRTKRHENGNADAYWLRTQSSSRAKPGRIESNGSFTWDRSYSYPVTSGIVLGCDVKQDAYVIMGSDGYYRVVDKDALFIGELAKNLPLGSKIKLSSNKTFVLRAKNVEGHRDNSVTLMSEYIIENAKWSNGIEKVPYSSSDIQTKTLQGYYNELSSVEKTCVISYRTFGNFWLMAEEEANALNLSVQGDRIMKFSNGKTGDWFTRDYRDSVGEQTQDGEPQDGVIKYKRDSFQDITKVWTGGKFADDEEPEYTGVEVSYSNDQTWRTESGAYQECGVVPFFDLDGDTKLEKGSDGYYRIVGM